MLLKKLERKLRMLQTTILVAVIIPLSVLSSGCSTTPSRVVIEQPNELLVCKVPLEVSVPSKVNWQPVKFYVVNKEIMQEILLGSDDYPEVLFAVDANGYENLSLNMQQIINHSEITKDILSAYKNYYRIDEKVLDNTGK